MPNKLIHLLGGLITGLIFLQLMVFFTGNQIINYFVFSIALLFLLIGSITPDFLEPPKNKFHRKFFHGKIMLGITLLTSIIFFNKINSIQFQLLVAFSLGYASHLLLDNVL